MSLVLMIDPFRSSIWQWLAFPDEELDRGDLVAANLAVARGVPSLENLDVARYCGIVDGWTERFASQLPRMERQFEANPEKFKNDIRFFRVGMVAGFLGREIGIRYIEEQRDAKTVRYTNPSHLFVNGVIDTKLGSCGNMATLHVAMCRRMGWPVSLACARSHLISRYDDGDVTHNIEMSSVREGTFASDSDQFYIDKLRLPKRATACGSDLRRLSTREMIGIFVAQRGRHFTDVNNLDRADTDFALARALFPHHRRSYIGAMIPALRRGATLFDKGELGHPNSFFTDLGPEYGFYLRDHPDVNVVPMSVACAGTGMFPHNHNEKV